MSFPYLDLAGFRARTPMPSTDVDIVEAAQPGWTVQQIAGATSYINARLRKRYGTSASASSLPLGQNPPALVAAGTLPPAVGLSGRPVIGCQRYQVRIRVGGALGTATFQWSADGGANWSNDTVTAALVPMTGTGLSLVFPTGTYSTDNLYASETAVPETVLGWLVALVTMALYRKRGANPQDPAIEMIKADADKALAELKEAADSKDGLFDLPASEDTDSAVTTGGPLGYSEQSPYTWTDLERQAASFEDSRNSP